MQLHNVFKVTRTMRGLTYVIEVHHAREPLMPPERMVKHHNDRQYCPAYIDGPIYSFLFCSLRCPLTLRITAGALTSFLCVITSPRLAPRTERAFFELLNKVTQSIARLGGGS